MIQMSWLLRAAVLSACLFPLPKMAVAGGDSPGITLFFNAQVFTAEPDRPYAEAVAVDGDRILAVGALTEVERAAGSSARRVDLKGKFLMPGILDAHAHPIDGGLELISASFPDTRDSVPALKEYVERQLQTGKSRRGDTLVVYDLDIGFWSHLDEIKAAFDNGPSSRQAIVLYGSDGHTAWASRPALTHAGITAKFIRGIASADRHYYGYDAAFNPNGFLVDAGKTKLDQSLPDPSPATMLEAARAAIHYMNGMGITGWLDAAVSGVVGGSTPLTANTLGNIPAYRALAQRGELSAHVVAYPVVQPDLGNQQIAVVEYLRDQSKDIENFSIPGLKVFADGVVEIPSQTAALTKPYRNNGRVATPFFDAQKMNALVAEAYRRGLTVHIHAIGDLAVKESLDAFEAARTANPSTKLPFVMTHEQFVDPEDIPRFARLHVISALQLLWAVADPSTNEQVKPYIDPGIYRWMYPARSILDSGGEIAGASDWPVSTANPFDAIFQAETRSGPQGVLDASQRMPRAAMLFAYTRHSAEVLDQLSEIGTIAPGKRADLALIDRDVLTIPADELRKASVVFTMFGGKIVYGQEP